MSIQRNAIRTLLTATLLAGVALGPVTTKAAEAQNLAKDSLLSRGLDLVGLESVMKSIRMQRTALEFERFHLELLRGALNSGRAIDAVVVENAPGYQSLARGGVVIAIGAFDAAALYAMRGIMADMLTFQKSRQSFSQSYNGGAGSASANSEPQLKTKLLRIPGATLKALGYASRTSLGLAVTATFIYGIGYFQLNGIDSMYLSSDDYKTLSMNTDLRIFEVQRQQEKLQGSLAQLEIAKQRRAGAEARIADKAAEASNSSASAPTTSNVFKLEE